MPTRLHLHMIGARASDGVAPPYVFVAWGGLLPCPGVLA